MTEWLDAGCARDCSEQHTYTWGRCALAPESARPEPTVSMSHVYVDTDGQNSIGFDSYTVTQLADLIAPTLQEPEEGFALPYSEDYGRELAREVATAIVQRNASPTDTAPDIPADKNGPTIPNVQVGVGELADDAEVFEYGCFNCCKPITVGQLAEHRCDQPEEPSQTTATNPATSSDPLHRLRTQLAAELDKARRADERPRPDLDHLRVTPHNGIAAGLEIALFYVDWQLREAGEVAGNGPRLDEAKADDRRWPLESEGK